jgi:predicted phosphodiesterase
MRIAVIADIHGNALALQAVLADMNRRSVDRVVNLGDVVSGPLWPRETMQLLSGRDWTTIRGNHDRVVAANDHGAMGASDHYAFGELDTGHRHWLGTLPMTQDIGCGILAFHATPADDTAYLVEQVHDRRLIRGSAAAIQRRLGDVKARIALCGHSHLPHLIQLPNGPLILNPGSVGLPAYDDLGANEPHVSESGSPFARYVVLTVDGDQVSVDMIALSYPWETAAQQAERNGRQEWAHALRTGFMPRPA